MVTNKLSKDNSIASIKKRSLLSAASKLSFKSLCLGAITSLILPCAIAQANPAFNGFYTGLGFGGSLTTGKLQGFSSASVITDDGSIVTGPSIPDGGGDGVVGPLTSNVGFKKTSVLGAIFGGYGYACNNFYLGSELFLKLSNNNASINQLATSFDNTEGVISSTSHQDNTTLSSRKLEFSLDARPGFLLSACSLLYGRIGVALNKTTLRSTFTGTVFNDNVLDAPVSQTLQVNASKKWGLRLGLGMEQLITECTSLRLDYIYTKYRKIRSTTSLSGFNQFPTSAYDTRTIKPENHAVMLGLSFYW